METKTAKQELRDVLDRLPDDAPMDQLLLEMQFKASVLRGLAEAQRGEGISHDELKARLDEWRRSSGRRRLAET